MRARSVLAVAGLGVVLAVAAPAVGGASERDIPTRLSLSAAERTVTGKAIDIEATLTDSRGRPVEDGLIRLLLTTEFMGSEREVVLDEARTDPEGKAELTFAPTEPGPAHVVAAFAGSPGFRPSQAGLDFDVRAPVPGWQEAPLGIGGGLARAPLILVPFIVVWTAYVVVLGLMHRIATAGRTAG